MSNDGRTYHKNNRLPFVVDQQTIIRTLGRQANFARTSDRFKSGAKKVTVGVAGAAKGAVTLPVLALLAALLKGTILSFGKVASVVVTVSGAALAAAISVPVNALSGPIPSGTVLDFGGGKFARLTANAPAGAVALTVAALPTALAGGETATYLGGAKVAVVSADTAAGETNVPVQPLPFALVSLDAAYSGGTGNKRVPAGTAICEDSAGKIFPRADLQAGETETAYGYCETDLEENSNTDAESGYGIIRGISLFENMLPDAIANGGEIPADWKTEMAANGALFMYDTYEDSRAA